MKCLRTLVVALMLLAWAIPAAAQAPAKVARIGVMSAGSPPAAFIEAFRAGLRDLGHVEGKNIVIDFRYAGGQIERYRTFAAELVGLNVDVILAGGGLEGARAAKAATSTIPIVIPAVADPVGAGLVTSLARPGGNVTGLSMQNTELSAKRLELLKEISPKAARVVILHDPAAEPKQVTVAERAARALRLQTEVVKAGRAEDLDAAFDAARRGRADAVVVLASSFFTTYRKRLVELAARHRLVAVYERREFADAGGLISYGPDIVGMYRRAATYVDRILKGARPADLPVEQPTKFELVVNLKTAKSLGLTIPAALVVRADDVIQ